MTATQTEIEYGIKYVFPGHLDETRIRQVAEKPRSCTINGTVEEGIHFVIDGDGFKKTMDEAYSPITLIAGRAVKDIEVETTIDENQLNEGEIRSSSKGIKTETRSYAMPPELHSLLIKISLPNEYNFPEPQDQNEIKNLAEKFKWFGEIRIHDSRIISLRPMPPMLFYFLRKNSKMTTPLLSLYQDCKDLYRKVLDEGERAFPNVHDILRKYGFAANCVLSETINVKETKERLGSRTANDFLKLALIRY
jgi:hypothetical protein